MVPRFGFIIVFSTFEAFILIGFIVVSSLSLMKERSKSELVSSWITDKFAYVFLIHVFLLNFIFFNYSSLLHRLSLFESYLDNFVFPATCLFSKKWDCRNTMRGLSSIIWRICDRIFKDRCWSRRHSWNTTCASACVRCFCVLGISFFGFLICRLKFLEYSSCIVDQLQVLEASNDISLCWSVWNFTTRKQSDLSVMTTVQPSYIFVMCLSDFRNNGTRGLP
jgi:hypothetical protein